MSVMKNSVSHILFVRGGGHILYMAKLEKGNNSLL